MATPDDVITAVLHYLEHRNDDPEATDFDEDQEAQKWRERYE